MIRMRHFFSVLVLAALSFGASCTTPPPAPNPPPDPSSDSGKACANLRALGFASGATPKCENAIDKTGGIISPETVRCWTGARSREVACACGPQLRDCP